MRKSGKLNRSDPRRRGGNRPTCVELFAGAGGLLLGLEQAGFRTLLANEVHPDPCKTIRRNLPHVPVVEAPIEQISGKELLEKAGYSRSTLPKPDLVAGGPPCQGFSTAGLKDPDDPRNTLIGSFIRIVKELQPRFFLLENVPGLVTLHAGRLYKNVLAQLDKIGYSFRAKVLYAADYGVPQMRKRLIVLGARSGAVPEHPEPAYKPPGDNGLFSSGLKPYVTCGDALGDLPLIGQGEIATEYQTDPVSDYQKAMRGGARVLHNHEASRHREATMAYYALVPPGGTALDIPLRLRKKKQGIQRWPVDRLSRSITTEPTDFLHPTLDRIPTVRELARIQSFPDTYVFLGQRTTGNKMRRLGYCSQTQQVGNAVPPRLAEAVGKSIKSVCG